MQVKTHLFYGIHENLITVLKLRVAYMGLVLFQDVVKCQPARWSSINNNHDFS